MMELLRINSCFKALLLFDVGWVEDFASSFLDLNIPSTVVDEVVSSFLVLKIDIVLLSGFFSCFDDCRLRVIVPPKAYIAHTTRRLAMIRSDLLSLDYSGKQITREMINVSVQSHLSRHILDTYLLRLAHTRSMT